MRFSTLIFCCFFGTCWTSRYCFHQPNTVSVKEGDSVTIPCSYSYPEHSRESQFIVTWGERDGAYCFSIKKNITDLSGNIMDEYKDRISIVKDPSKNRTESLLIRGVKASDGVSFCCRVTELSASWVEFTWNVLYGTSLTIADKDELSQMEELMAVPGEEMIIPCHYPMRSLGKAQQVTWYTGDKYICLYDDNKIIYTWDGPQKYGQYSLVNFPEDVSMRIHHVLRAENSRFCCRVTTSNGTMATSFGTELTTAGSLFPAPFTVTQPEGVTGHEREAVTLNCSYSGYKESDVLGVNIYWRLGNTSGPYVYHPYKEMLHPSYRGRTEIKGAADLHIRGLQTSDNSTYYCFVMIRLCVEAYQYPKYVQYGDGTRLIVTEHVQTPSSPHQSSVIFAFCTGCKFVFALALLILSLVTYKDTR